MHPVASVVRSIAKASFWLRGLASITDIPTDQLNEIIRGLISDGWEKYYEYEGFDAWIDYGCVKLRRERVRLKFEWDNWTEGSIEGRSQYVRGIAVDHGLEVRRYWTWSIWD
ncbi:MAG: hypothetical protein AAF385_06395 [Pseudomonadota bacterium]